MVQDFFKRELKVNDLVVSKATGRHSSMSSGIIVKNDKGEYKVDYGGTIGGAEDTCLITDTSLEWRRQELINMRIKYLQEREDRKIANKSKKLKRSDFVEFGVYSTNEYSRELYLPTCLINGEQTKEVWIRLYNKEYKEDFGIDNMCADLFTYSYRKPYRVCKYPQKFKEDIVLTKEQVLKVLSDAWDKIDRANAGHYSNRYENRFIELK